MKSMFVPVAISCLLLASGCEKAKPIPADIPSVLVCPAKTIEIPSTVQAVGQVVPIEFVYLVARVEGYLTSRQFNPGDYVKRGQLLYQIQKDQYKAQYSEAQGDLMKAQSTYDNALIEYNRQKLMLVQNATSQEDVDNANQAKYDAEASLVIAKAKYDLQVLNLSYTDIYAPFDGRIGMYAYSVGNVVGPNIDSLAEVIKMDPRWAEFPISEPDLVTLMEKEKGFLTSRAQTTATETEKLFNVRVQLSNNTWYPKTGKINYLSNKIDPKAGTIQARAVLIIPRNCLFLADLLRFMSKRRKSFLI